MKREKLKLYSKTPSSPKLCVATIDLKQEVFEGSTLGFIIGRL